MAEEIYLDNAATTKAFPAVAAAVKDALVNNYANPSSLHQKGLAAEKLIKSARRRLAQTLKVGKDEIYYTSGGTEANNLAIQGTLKSLGRAGERIITTEIEHPSVLNLFKELEEEWDVKYLSVDQKGQIDLKELQEYLNNDTILLSIMAVNNEIGTIQPLSEVSALINDYQDLYWHVDGIQALGKIDIFPKHLGIDLYSMSGHKIHGPKGVGALYAAADTNLRSIFKGSQQEQGLRPGTENVPGIAGFDKAVELLASAKERKQLYKLKERLVDKILTQLEGSRLIGPELKEGAPHILNILFSGLKGEVLVHSLAQDDIYLSTGAACSSQHKTSNHVLEAIGITEAQLDQTIRFSLATTNTRAEIDRAANKLVEHSNRLRKMM